MTSVLEQGRLTALSDLDLAVEKFALTRNEDDALEVSRLLTVLEMFNFMIEVEQKNEPEKHSQAVPKG
jgi:hypothetical protein